MQNVSRENTKVVDEIIDNAAGFPVESQYMILMMAKAMQYTHNSVLRQGTVHSSSLAPKTDT